MKTIELDIELVRNIKIELYSSYEQLLDVEESEWAETFVNWSKFLKKN